MSMIPILDDSFDLTQKGIIDQMNSQRLLAPKGYQLERTPSRDKHAGGVAERAVGVIVAKANVAMLSPDNPVPQIYWDLAMTYACDTAS